ncbi:hypothetical protein OROGR_004564 [Orobanche gracilis]
MVKNSFLSDQDEKMVTYGSKKQVTSISTTSSKRSGGERKSGKGNQKIDPRQKSFTPQEEELVIQLHATIGSRWAIIAQQLPGRTDNDVKILWNSKLRKKLSAMGIDPVTHKPFSQILADYGNIGAFPKARTRFSSLSRDLKNAIILKSEQHHKNPQTLAPNHFSSLAPKQGSSSDQRHAIDLYSQLQAVNFITEASNYARNEITTQHLETGCVSSSLEPLPLVGNQEVPSFSWSDIFLGDEFLGQENNEGIFSQFDGNIDGKAKCVVEDKNIGGFEVSSSSNSSTFVDAMLESQDAMFSELSCFSEEPFYY